MLALKILERMRMKTVTIRREEVKIKCKLINVPSDGACLFSALSFLMFQTISMAGFVRVLTVHHVIENWERLKAISLNQHLAPYTSARQYMIDMSNPRTYGTTCELMAAGEVFNYQFQLFSTTDGKHIGDFGLSHKEVKRIGFSGNFSSGHFDVLIPADEYDSLEYDKDELAAQLKKTDAKKPSETKRNGNSKRNKKDKEIKYDVKRSNETKTKPNTNKDIKTEAEINNRYQLRQRKA